MAFSNYQKYPLVIQSCDLFQLHQFFQISTSLVSSEETERKYSSYQSIHGFGAKKEITPLNGACLKTIESTIDQQPAFYFICLSYDLKNEIEDLSSKNEPIIDLPDVFFFEPKFVVIEESKAEFYLYVQSIEEKLEFEKILKQCIESHCLKSSEEKIKLSPKISKQQYIAKFEQIQNYIQQGDFYEMNYCQAFVQENTCIEPTLLFQKVCEIAQAPFMAYLQKGNQFLISASPERYIRKEGAKIISQPIKGTIKRGSTKELDEQNKRILQSSLKEKTENVMIVDLVRNDFGKICEAGAVQVEELYGVYSYPTVHQLVSTVTGQLRDGVSFSDVLKATFPMGSMTGAPKCRVMQLTEELEAFKRGWYSGSVGYILPNGDFDLNVIIRSFIYNKLSETLLYGVGGGITASSTAEAEYEECLLKVNSLVDKLNKL